ncbi:MAG: hypothetical protein Cons2KO_15150 [Congregibacter sp.]
MGDHRQESTSDDMDDMYEPIIGELAKELNDDFSEDAYEGRTAVSMEKLALAEKRRRAEQRLEERRLREELGDYDFVLDDY